MIGATSFENVTRDCAEAGVLAPGVTRTAISHAAREGGTGNPQGASSRMRQDTPGYHWPPVFGGPDSSVRLISDRLRCVRSAPTFRAGPLRCSTHGTWSTV